MHVLKVRVNERQCFYKQLCEDPSLSEIICLFDNEHQYTYDKPLTVSLCDLKENILLEEVEIALNFINLKIKGKDNVENTRDMIMDIMKLCVDIDAMHIVKPDISLYHVLVVLRHLSLPSYESFMTIISTIVFDEITIIKYETLMMRGLWSTFINNIFEMLFPFFYGNKK
jgi:hypothetical protein